MNLTTILLLLALYLHLGWCWADVMSRFTVHPLRRSRYALALILWPLSLMIISTNLEEDDENQ